MSGQTPVEEHGGLLVKRDDLYELGGSCGGKVRTCLALGEAARAAGCAGLVTAGSRQSPQVNIVATVAASLGLACRAHVPAGALTPELAEAQAAGAVLVSHRPGYNTVIVARARDDAALRGWAEVPFGMEHPEAVAQTASQVAALAELAEPPSRIVIPVGSGMSLAGLLAGMASRGLDWPVLGVVCGAEPSRRLDRFAPRWRRACELTPAGLDYHRPAPASRLGGLELDPIYEAKCLPFLRPGDLLWVVGRRASLGAPHVSAGRAPAPS